MFNITVKFGSGMSVTMSTVVDKETLPEAEEFTCRLLAGILSGVDFVMLHKGDLTYDVVRTDEPLAHVEITTGG